MPRQPVLKVRQIEELVPTLATAGHKPRYWWPYCPKNRCVTQLQRGFLPSATTTILPRAWPCRPSC